MRDSMIFYRSFAEAISCLDEHDQLEAFWNIVNYALDEDEPDGSGAAVAVFKMAKPQIDTNLKRYESAVKGGEAKKAKAKLSQTEAKPKPKLSQSEAKRVPNDNVNVNDNDNDNVNDNVNDNENENAVKENVLTDIRESAQEQAFDEFWDLYPKKKSKGQAKRAWNKLNPSKDTIIAIMAKLPELIASYDWQKEGGRYIPYPATWLNAEGWDDESPQRPLNKYEEVDSWV